MTSASSGRKPTANPQTDTTSAGVGTSGQDRPRPEESEDTIEQVQADIDAFREERLAGRETTALQPETTAAGNAPDGAGPAVGHSPSRPASRVFACDSEAIDETCGGEDLVCICDDPEIPESRRCPIHEEATD